MENHAFADACLGWAPAWALVAPSVRYLPSSLKLPCPSWGVDGGVSAEYVVTDKFTFEFLARFGGMFWNGSSSSGYNIKF